MGEQVQGDRVFIHLQPRPDECEHEFAGWRQHEDGHGGEQVCTKCGVGAMEFYIRCGQ